MYLYVDRQADIYTIYIYIFLYIYIYIYSSNKNVQVLTIHFQQVKRIHKVSYQEYKQQPEG